MLQPKKTPSCNFENILKCLEESEVKVTTKVISKEHEKGNKSSKKLSETSDNNELQIEEADNNDFTPVKKSYGLLDDVIRRQNKIISRTDVADLFVHGQLLSKPYEDIGDATFYPEIRDSLRALKFRTLFRTQSYSWPNIAEGRNILIVNNQNSGKTFSYLPAILTSVMSWDESKPPSAQGPIGIIIVRSSREVEMLYKYCLKMVPRDKISVIKAFGKWNCHNKKVELLNGCDLLITTPPCFSRLAEGEAIRMFSKHRVKHLVFDGLDSMHEIFEKEIKIIIKTCTYGEKHTELNPEIIITSTSWIDYIRNYLKLSPDPIVVIGSYVEAAVYAKCRFTVLKNSHQGKLERLKARLKKNKWETKKTLVVLNTQTELENVAGYLENAGVALKRIDNKSTPSDNAETCKLWVREKQEKMTIMLATDEHLLECKLKCVEVLIHFSLPSSWSKFSRRFSTMNDSFMDMVTEKTTERAYTIVLLDERNVKEIPRLIAFLESHKVVNEISKDIKDLVKLIVEEREGTKREIGEEITPVCSNIYYFGKCRNIYNCHKRHAFTKSDKPVNIPVDGLLKFELVGIQNPSHYVIKILEHLPAGAKKWISCEEKIKKIEKSMEELQEVMKEVCVIHVGVKLNDIVAVFCIKIDKWCRCRVLEKQNTDSPGKFKAIVHCIDFGYKLIVQSTDMMVLPESIKLLDPLVIDLRIVNLVPYDKDENFDHETTAELKKFFPSKKKIGDYMLAEVDFTVQSIIFAQTFEIRYNIDGVNVTKYSLKMDLLKRNFCLKDETVADNLKELLKRAKLYIPDKTKAEVKLMKTEQQKVLETQPEWKNLTIGNEYQVYVKHFESPDLFYVCLDDSTNNVLRNLTKTVENCETRIPLMEIKEGSFCLLVQEGQKPKRGMITKVEEDSYNIFLLDVGELIVVYDNNEIFELPNKLIKAFPFQAVQCCLMNVKPKFKQTEWPSRGLRAMRDFISDFCGNFLMSMRVIARHKNVFDVILFSLKGKKKLHEVLVDERLADAKELDDPTSNDYESVEEIEAGSSTTSYKPVNQFKSILNLLNDPLSDVKLAPQIQHQEPIPAANNLVEESKTEKKLIINKQQISLPSTLSYIHKHPKIEWRQNDVMVWLSVAATDCIDYALKISDSWIKVHIIYKAGYYEYTSFELFGVILEQYVSHEKVGEKVIIRLLKRLYLPWTRLTEIEDLNRFITYNFEHHIPNFSCANRNALTIARPAGDSDDDGNECESEISDENEIKDINDPIQ